MLLKDNIQRLLKLGLGRAKFVLVKKIFRNSETLATSKQRLFFLRQCSTLNISPKTIGNLRLPYDFAVESITEKSKQRTRRFVLNESSSDQRNRTTNLNSTDNNNTSSSDVTSSKPNLVTDLTNNLNAQFVDFVFSKKSGLALTHSRL